MAGAKDLASTDTIDPDLLTALKKLADGADELRRCIEKSEAEKGRSADESLRELDAHSSQGEDNDHPEPCDATRKGRATRYGYGDAAPEWLHREFEQAVPTQERLEELWQAVLDFIMHSSTRLSVVRIRHKGDPKEFSLMAWNIGEREPRWSVDGDVTMDKEVLVDIIHRQWLRPFRVGNVLQNRLGGGSGGLTDGEPLSQWTLEDFFKFVRKSGFFTTKNILIVSASDLGRIKLFARLDLI